MFGHLEIIAKSGNVYRFTGRSYGTAHGFAHEVELSGAYYETAKVNYINRTWERYNFQTAYLIATAKVRTWIKEQFIAAWKDARGYRNLTASRRAELERDIENNEQYKELCEVIETLERCDGYDVDNRKAAA